MNFRLTVNVRNLDWWSQGSTMHTTTSGTTMSMCSLRKLQTRYVQLVRLQNWLPTIPDCREPARDPVGDDRLQEIVSKYRVSESDCPATLRWYVSNSLLGWFVPVGCDINSGKWRPRDKTQVRLEHDDVTLACASALVHKKIYRSNIIVLFFFYIFPSQGPGGLWYSSGWSVYGNSLSILQTNYHQTSSQAPSHARRLQPETMTHSLNHWQGWGVELLA